MVSHNAAIAACESAGEWEMALAVCAAWLVVARIYLLSD